MNSKSRSLFPALFGSSPFKMVQEHMRKVFSCICFLPLLMDSLYRQDRAQIEEYCSSIIQLETEADAIKQNFRINMPNTLLLPVDREDMLSLMSEQDRMSDITEDIAKTLLFRNMEVPESLREILDELLEGTMEISAAAKDMIERLDELVEVGFYGREYMKITAMIEAVRRSEHNIDSILFRANRILFEHEKGMDPVSVIFWYELINLLGSLSDTAENVADRLLLFLSK